MSRDQTWLFQPGSRNERLVGKQALVDLRPETDSEEPPQLESDLDRSQILKPLKKGAIAMIAGLASAGVAVVLDPTKLAAALLLAPVASATVVAIAEALSAPAATDAKRGALAHFVAVLD